MQLTGVAVELLLFPTRVFSYLSIYPSIYLSIYLSGYLSIYLLPRTESSILYNVCLPSRGIPAGMREVRS